MLNTNKKNEYSNIFKETLINKGWQFIESGKNNIILNKQYSELEEINILFNDSINGIPIFHLKLPLKKSEFSFYIKIYSEETFSEYIKQYIEYISF